MRLLPTVLASLLIASMAVERPAAAQALSISERASSTRETRPASISFAASLFAFGIDASYQLTDRFALGVQAATLGPLHNELSLRSRYFVVAGPRSGLYLGANAHFIPYSPLLFSSPGGGGSFELGYEFRARNGFVVGAGAGLAALYGGCACGSGPDGSSRHHWDPFPVANLRLGQSW